MYDKKMKVFDYVNYALMCIVSFTMVYPFLHIAFLSVSNPVRAAAGGFFFYPRGFQIDIYKGILHDKLFWHSYLNIVIVTAVGTTVALALLAMGAYVMTVRTFPFRKTVTALVTFTMFFQAGIIPNYLLYKQLGMMNTWIPLWIPGITSAFYVIILISFFRQLPNEIKEAGLIDGAGEMTIFFRLLLPLTKPVLATVALFLAVQYWNDWYSPYIYLSKPHLFTLPTVLRSYVVEQDMQSFSGYVARANNQVLPDQMKATVILVAILPTLIFYPFLQRYFVKGMTLGSLKS